MHVGVRVVCLMAFVNFQRNRGGVDAFCEKSKY